jgi:ribosomal protein S19E (S16A)
LVEYAKSLVPDRVKKLRAEGEIEGVLNKFLGEVGAVRRSAKGKSVCGKGRDDMTDV